MTGGKLLHTSWEDMAILIARPRTQQTTAYAIPAVLAAPGPALATSNKRDLVDATAAVRAARVSVFDPQKCGGHPGAVVEPADLCGAGRPAHRPPRRLPSGQVDASETRADRVGAQLVTLARPGGVRTDAYFDTAAENLISLLLAAACAEEPVTARLQLVVPLDVKEAADVLAGQGLALQAQALVALSWMPDKQGEGVHGAARSLTSCGTARSSAPWVTAGAGGPFHPADFARSTDTLYPLGWEGTGVTSRTARDVETAPSETTLGDSVTSGGTVKPRGGFIAATKINKPHTKDSG